MPTCCLVSQIRFSRSIAMPTVLPSPNGQFNPCFISGFSAYLPLAAHSILQKTRVHRNTLSLHIACMQHLPNLRSRLFLLAHELMQKEPQDAMSAYAVAVWYIFTKKYALARRWIA